ncbi:hypothetical protein BGZ61DRAFT_373573 [Ilyonectria robusta]|uniref:uncharacterized protein n=1 Tax=Ilyonectria robusta TaxID=1079257 RepID=UPI001E8D87BA|nr:uncharacterized protein BGZ61DRAFT_373573 [Ilyonectria robusta]KAH8654368.1 hypothetical protein BGZ61DRAFT_373573 [Ilyonectria robusta]
MTDKKIVLVTGGNTGLGFQIIRAISRSEINYEILLAGRSLEKAQAAVKEAIAEYPSIKGRISPIQVDIEDDASIEATFQQVKAQYGRLDALVNNAGAQFDPLLRTGQMTMREVWNKSWNTNTTGTYIMTHTFVPLLLESRDPRLLFITSGTSTIAGTGNTALPVNRVPPKGWPKDGQINLPAYRSSKTGMNMMMREWYRVLQEDGVKVWGISPGFLATGLGGNPEMNKKLGGADPALGGEFIKEVLEGQRDADVGRVILREGVQPW